MTMIRTRLLLLSVSFISIRNHVASCFHSLQLKQERKHRNARFGVASQNKYDEFVSASKSSARRLHSASLATSEDSFSNTPTYLSPKTASVIHEYVSKVKNSVQKNTFVSLTLRGPSVPKKGKNKVDKERLRGCIRQVQGRLIEINNKKKQKSEVLLQATIKYHGATDVAKNWRVTEDLDDIGEGLSSLFFPLAADSSSVLSEWGERGLHNAGTELGIQGGELCCSEGVWELDVSYRGKKSRIWKRKTPKESESNGAVVAPATHDRTKKVPLSPDAPFFHALGLTKADGKPRPAMSSKLKQCQKFVEIVGGLVETTLATRDDVSCLSTVDMGCGRGYLTFSLHSYLTNKYAVTRRVLSRGIDMRPKLVNEITEVAKSLGPEFFNLTFEQGTIERALASEPDQHPTNTLDVLIALHACDTATDDALWSGIQSSADVLVVAPCCHKEVRQQLDPHVAKLGKDHPLADVLRHGIYRERMAETVTDSMRALLLEIAGYNTQVFEFIGGKHTSKNVMITATKRKQGRTSAELEELRQRLRALSSLHGIKTQRLAAWIGEDLSDDKAVLESSCLSSKNMPPLY